MDSSSLSNRERRRNAAASRRAGRENVDHYAKHTPERATQRQRQPLDGNLLSSLSQALTNIDNHNNDYFSRQNGSDGHNGGDHKHHYDSETITFSSPNKNTSMGHGEERKSKMYSRLPPPPSQFSSYLKFTRLSLNCLLTFTGCYLLVLIICYPMISFSNVEVLPTDDDFTRGGKHHIKRGASFQHIRGRKQFLKVKDKLGTLKERAIKWEEEAKLKAQRGAVELQEAEKEIVDSIAGGTIGRRDGEDARRASALLEQAVKDFDEKRSELEKEEEKKKAAANQRNMGEHDHWKDAVEAWDKEFIPVRSDAEDASNANPGKTPGFMVLGMHRSGTSMLSGLLVKGFGYETGGPLIGASFDNEKGFYERIDVVLQNDEFMYAQNSGWSWNVINYDPEKALQHKAQGRITFKEGKTGLKFFNNHARLLPYLQKDPRMCITLPTWLKLIDHKPAVVFTYRHPLEVAMSLKHREQDFTIEHGLRLWIIYNMKALQNSAGLCRVFSTNEAVFKDPKKEVQRIKNELTGKCRVVAPPTHEISSDVVDVFVDPKLQHNSNERKAEEESKPVLKDFGGGCVARDFVSDYDENSENRRAEVDLYLMAMQVFCDLESGRAYREDYEWPDLVHWHRPAKIS